MATYFSMAARFIGRVWLELASRVARLVVVPFVVLPYTAWIPLSVAADCWNWTSQEFWVALTPFDVHNCLANGSSPNARSESTGVTPLHLTVGLNTDSSVTAALLEGGADPDALFFNDVLDDVTPLRMAIEHNDNPAVINALISGEAEVDARGQNGFTPLHFAVLSKNNPAVINVLIAGGADPNAQTDEGTTALHMAARHKMNLSLVVALIKGGADPNVKDRHGYTSLHLATMHTDDPAIISRLLGGGTSAEARTE